MNKENKKLIKLIRYRISYSGMKETDILYKKLILNKLEDLNISELNLLSNLFNEISDFEIFNILTNKVLKPKKYNDLLTKILNE